MTVIYTQYLVCCFQHFTTLSIFTNKQSPFFELFTFSLTSKLLNQELQDSTDTEHPDLVQISNRNLLCQNHAQTFFPTFLSSVALLILLSAATWTRIISANLWDLLKIYASKFLWKWDYIWIILYVFLPALICVSASRKSPLCDRLK